MNENQKEFLVKDGVQFLKTITEIYGVEKGMELWDKLCSVLSPEVKGAICFSMLTGNTGGGHFHIKMKNNFNSNLKIRRIKLIREITGMGLKQALNFVEELENTPGVSKTITIRENSLQKRNELRDVEFDI